MIHTFIMTAVGMDNDFSPQRSLSQPQATSARQLQANLLTLACTQAVGEREGTRVREVGAVGAVGPARASATRGPRARWAGRGRGRGGDCTREGCRGKTASRPAVGKAPCGRTATEEGSILACVTILALSDRRRSF